MELLKKLEEFRKRQIKKTPTGESKTSVAKDKPGEESEELYNSIQPFAPKADIGLPEYEKGVNDDLVITVYYVLPDGSERHTKGIIINCARDYICIGHSGCEYARIFNRKGQSQIIRAEDSKGQTIYRHRDYSEEIEDFYLDRLSGRI